MTEQEVNEVEWRSADNWSGGALGVYFCKRDSRVWVPKKQPWMGWTLNLAHPAGVWWLFGLLTLPFATTLILLLAVAAKSST
ncbi:MAG: DUF5808 domain-containing protein [Pirellulaceae bacterium]